MGLWKNIPRTRNQSHSFDSQQLQDFSGFPWIKNYNNSNDTSTIKFCHQIDLFYLSTSKTYFYIQHSINEIIQKTSCFIYSQHNYAKSIINLILQMCVFALKMNSAIDTINLQKGFCMKFTTHLGSQRCSRLRLEHLLRSLRALLTIRVNPELEGRTLNIVHSLN